MGSVGFSAISSNLKKSLFLKKIFYRNQISTVLPGSSSSGSSSSSLSHFSQAHLMSLKASLSTLFLGSNDLTEVEPEFFNGFRRLDKLNLDSNLIKELRVYDLPR